MTYHSNRDPTERMFETLSKNPDVEIGLQRLENNPNTDPLLRAMATTVRKECELGRKRREDREFGNAIGAVIIVIFLVIGLVVAVSRSRSRY